MGKFDDITGRIIRNWQVSDVSHKTKNGALYWKVRCTNCGHETALRSYKVRKCRCKHCSCLPQGFSGSKRLYARYKRASKNLKRSFELSLEQFRILTSSSCFYCGSPPFTICINNTGKARKETSTWNHYLHNGIDRKDNQIGYTLDNCLPCCVICNRAKNNMSFEDFGKYISRIKDNVLANKIPMFRD